MQRERLCFVRPAAVGFAAAALAALVVLGGCEGGGNDTVTVQQGNTTRTLSTRTLRPIDLREGRAIAEDVASGKKKPEKLTVEEQRQLNAFVQVIKKPVKKED